MWPPWPPYKVWWSLKYWSWWRLELGLEMIFPDIDIISRSRVVSREIELLIVSPDVGLLRNVIQYLQFPCRNLKMDILVDSRNSPHLFFAINIRLPKLSYLQRTVRGMGMGKRVKETKMKRTVTTTARAAKLAKILNLSKRNKKKQPLKLNSLMSCICTNCLKHKWIFLYFIQIFYLKLRISVKNEIRIKIT